MKSRSVTADREARGVRPISRFNISSVAAFVRPGIFATVSVYLSIKSVTVVPLGTGANPPGDDVIRLALDAAGPSLRLALLVERGAPIKAAATHCTRHLPLGSWENVGI
jgi:hypothetical protein